MGFQKNVAGQKWRVFAFDRTDNTPVTGDAAQITAKIAIDDAAAAPLGDGNPTETEDGYYLFDLTQAETDGNKLSLYPESSTPDVQVVASPADVFTIAPNAQATVISASGVVNGNIVELLGAPVTGAAVDANVVSSTAGAREEFADTLLDRDMATGTDSGSPTVRTVRQALRALRNRWAVVTGTLTVYKEDDTTVSHSGPVTSDATADPITGVDPT